MRTRQHTGPPARTASEEEVLARRTDRGVLRYGKCSDRGVFVARISQAAPAAGSPGSSVACVPDAGVDSVALSW
jgi:hypothetical protein